MKKILMIAAWEHSLAEIRVHQIFMDASTYLEMDSVDLKRLIIANHYSMKAGHVSDKLLESAVLTEGLVAKPAFFAIHVDGDVFPVLHGPFENEVCRDLKAGELRLDNDEDGVYALQIDQGEVSVDSWSGNGMDELVGCVVERRAHGVSGEAKLVSL